MRKMIALAVALFVTACAAPLATPIPQDAAQQVFAAKTAYQAVLLIAVRYNQLPRCTVPKAPPLCSDQTVVVQLRKADDAALATLDSAEIVVRSPRATATLTSDAVLAAQSAVKAFQSIVTIYAK